MPRLPERRQSNWLRVRQGTLGGLVALEPTLSHERAPALIPPGPLELESLAWIPADSRAAISKENVTPTNVGYQVTANIAQKPTMLHNRALATSTPVNGDVALSVFRWGRSGAAGSCANSSGHHST